ncbi:MAG: hypothetical protein AVDCRST_MAG77-2955, partial [uncultured Chloroflexi bacterium]
ARRSEEHPLHGPGGAGRHPWRPGRCAPMGTHRQARCLRALPRHARPTHALVRQAARRLHRRLRFQPHRRYPGLHPGAGLPGRRHNRPARHPARAAPRPPGRHGRVPRPRRARPPFQQAPQPDRRRRRHRHLAAARYPMRRLGAASVWL